MAANDVPCCETMFWVYLVISVNLVCFAGLMSGLTLGLMSLSLVDLEVLIKAGRPEDRKNAEKIYPIVKNQHLLLCTLLIYNSLAMEALPIFLDALLPADWGAILISVTFILAFGEIIPQSVCSRYGLSIGARLSVLVRLLVLIVFPFSYPISKLLDLLLGKSHSALLRRAELKTLVDMHGNEAGKGGELTHDETTIISGALDLTEKTARDAMTPLSKVFSLDLNAKFDNDTMDLIISSGHSRIPIYSGSPTNIVGLLLVKNLIKCRQEVDFPIRNLTIRRIPRYIIPTFYVSSLHQSFTYKTDFEIFTISYQYVTNSSGFLAYDRFNESLPLYDILSQFQKGQSHMGVVVKNASHLKDVAESIPPKSNELKPNVNSYLVTIISVESLSSSPSTDEEVLGIITMEDVLEELLQGPIFDEKDEYVDIHHK
ncbi:DUF21 domain-containing protein At5g52790-like [Primulina tabacum]|uniref:DUF21 domain-containing protein At5g52790-like n=1 Tax=Primulina tabacum TaxID=48773 RepID=UPI003F59242C